MSVGSVAKSSEKIITQKYATVGCPLVPNYFFGNIFSAFQQKFCIFLHIETKIRVFDFFLNLFSDEKIMKCSRD